MAKVIVKYTATFKQTLDWPDDELGDFNYENLQVNLRPSEDDETGDEFEILSVKLNGEEYDF